MDGLELTEEELLQIAQLNQADLGPASTRDIPAPLPLPLPIPPQQSYHRPASPRRPSEEELPKEMITIEKTYDLPARSKKKVIKGKVTWVDLPAEKKTTKWEIDISW
jgi:hypothetical protein